jgi:cysteine synthase A
MNSILNTIGNTPLITVEGIQAKLETYNPSGSIKDRMAWHIIQEAINSGHLKTGMEILEVTSGNTGIALAMISAIHGYKFTAVMPESMSVERRKMIKNFGGKIILTPAKEDVAGAVKKYEELAAQNPNFWLPKQFENPANIKAHELTTAPEIIQQTKGKIDAFVAATGTGGTLIGVAKTLKAFNPKIKVIAVEPTQSPVISGGKPGLHKIQGIGEGFVPKIVQDNLHLIDEVITINDQDAIQASSHLAKQHGILVGISSGANFLAAKQAKQTHKNIITIFPDRGERYLN